MKYHEKGLSKVGLSALQRVFWRGEGKENDEGETGNGQANAAEEGDSIAPQQGKKVAF